MPKDRSNTAVREADSALLPRISYVVGRLDSIIYKRISEGVEPHGLTVPQYTTLSVLGRKSGLSNAQLARRAYVSPQAMGEVLDQLSVAGLVAREPHASHGRILEVHLSPKGKKVLALCDTAVDALEAEMMHDLSAAKQGELLQGLLACVRSLHGGLEP